IGVVESAVPESARFRLAGAAHDARIDTGELAQIVVDRTGRMGGKAYPRIEFLTAEGAVLFNVGGFEVLAPFDAALAPLGVGTEVDAQAPKAAGERGEVAEGDPGAIPLEQALASGEEIIIGFRRRGFEQLWRGRVEAVKPAMGFINIIRP